MKEAEQMIDDGKGLGPVKNVTLSDTLDEQIAMQGFEIFKVKCAACHKFTNERFIGPGLMGVTKRRKPEWIMNMIMNPIEMAQKDPAAKELVSMYLVQMTDLNVSESESRSILEYFRKIDSASN
ncbi:MAG: cytochrome c [Bacteroidia bacterium]|nr:cytochrome c [Bacteroidia bacterium]